MNSVQMRRWPTVLLMALLPALLTVLLSSCGLPGLRGEAVHLSNAWRFVPGRFSAGVESGVPVDVPGSWHSNPALGMDGPYGFGSYGVRFAAPDGAGPHALLIPDQAIAFRVLLNGEVVGANGVPGRSYADTQVRRGPIVVPLDPEQSEHELLIHVSNYHYDVGGLINPPLLTTQQHAVALRELRSVLTGVLAGALALIGLYYFLLYAQQDRERAWLLFGLFCMVMLVRVLNVAHIPERFLSADGARWPFELSIRLEFLSFYLALPLYLSFVASLFVLPRYHTLRWVVPALAALASAAVLLLPVPQFIRLTIVPYQVLTVLVGAYLLVSLLLSARRGEEGARVVLVGYLFLFVLVLNDLLHAALLIQTGHLMPFGLLIFVVAHFVVLTRRHIGAEQRTRSMAADLAHERDGLDARVAERTAELELANEKLRRQEEARLEFVASISHELRTPLTLIRTPAEQVIRKQRGSVIPADGEVLRSITRNARRIETLIENLLDYSRFELGKLEPELKPLELGSVVESLTRELFPVAQEKELELVFSNELPGPAPAAADLRLLELAVFNLLSNALKFTPAGGRVDLRICAAEGVAGGMARDMAGSVAGGVTVEVADTGVGIDDEAMPHIFEKFYRGCAEVDGSRPGSGIGLALTQEIVQLHGGTLSVESTPGSGSRFRMTLPTLPSALSPPAVAVAEPAVGADPQTAPPAVQAPPASPGPPPAVQAPPPAPPAAATVLIVEDDAELRAYLTQELARSYHVLQAPDGEAAIELLESEAQPDIIIADIMMPRVDGPALFAHLRAQQQYHDIPVVFLTARTDTAMERRLREQGAVEYLRKPFDLDELMLKVRNLLALQAGIRTQAAAGLTRRLSQFLAQEQQTSVSFPFTLAEREQQICTLLVRGLTDKEIGHELGIAARTVSNILSRIYRKTSTTNRTELTSLLRG